VHAIRSGIGLAHLFVTMLLVIDAQSSSSRACRKASLFGGWRADEQRLHEIASVPMASQPKLSRLKASYNAP
jgi:hypothetical protein